MSAKEKNDGSHFLSGQLHVSLIFIDLETLF